MKAIVNETKKFNAAISGAGAHDSRALEDIFEKCRHDEKKMTTLVRAFCEAYLVDNQNRPLKMRPLQEKIVVTALTHPCLLYTSPSPRDQRGSRMPSSA